MSKKLTTVGLCAAASLLVTGHFASAAELIDTQIDVNVVASNISARGIPGSSGSSHLLFWGSKKSKPALESPVEIGVVDVAATAHVRNSRFRLNVIASGINAEGAPVSIGALRVR